MSAIVCAKVESGTHPISIPLWSQCGGSDGGGGDRGEGRYSVFPNKSRICTASAGVVSTTLRERKRGALQRKKRERERVSLSLALSLSHRLSVQSINCYFSMCVCVFGEYRKGIGGESCLLLPRVYNIKKSHFPLRILKLKLLLNTTDI